MGRLKSLLVAQALVLHIFESMIPVPFITPGAIFSFVIMILIKKIGRDKVSLIGVSAAGAVFHNIGQIIIAALIVQNVNISLYLPILTIAGIGTGFFVGVTARYILKHLEKINSNNKLFDNKR